MIDWAVMPTPAQNQDTEKLTPEETRDLLLELAELRRKYEELRRGERNRLRMEARIRHSQKLESLGVLAGGIAHDFNNQLMGVLGNIEMALDEVPAGSSARAYLADATLSARAMAKLTHQMLAYSGKGIYVVHPLDLARLVEEIQSLLETSVGRGVELRYELAPDLPTIDGDADQLRQVVLNFVANASEAMGGGGGTVTLTTGRFEATSEYLGETLVGTANPVPGEYVFLEVADNGSGMDPATCERIFDPFFSTKFTGRGLGLAVSLGIVRGHNGVIKVESELGQGTRLRALFPPSAKAAAGKAPQAVDEPWRGHGTVLVADDEGPVLRVAQRMLEKSGFKVLAASDGREALELFRAHVDEIVAVILDLTMPQVGGEEAFAEMSKVRGDLPILLASGYDERALARRFNDKRPAGFIQKPYRRQALVEKLKAALSGESS